MPDPPWRIKSLPCPFYIQGRCIFEDSCNFLHLGDVRPPAVINSVAAHVNSGQLHTKVKDSSHVNIPSSTPSVIPTPYVKHATPLRTFGLPPSPMRSPRISGLLLALQDVIDPAIDDEDPPGDHISIDVKLKAFEKSDIHSHLLVPSDAHSSESKNDHHNATLQSEDSRIATEDDASVLFGREDSEDNDRTAVEFRESTQAPPAAPVDSHEEETPRAELADPLSTPQADQPQLPQCLMSLLSPVDMSIQPLLPLRIRDASVDSGYAEDPNTWSGPSPLSASPPLIGRNRKLTAGVPFMFDSPPSSLCSSPVKVHGGAYSSADGLSTLPLPSDDAHSSADLPSLAESDPQTAIKSGSSVHFLATEDPSFGEAEPDAQSSLQDALRSLKSLVAESGGDDGSDEDGDSPSGSPYLRRPPGLTVSPSISQLTSNPSLIPSPHPVDGLASAKRKWGAVIGELSMLSLPLREAKSDDGGGGEASHEPPSEPTQSLASSPRAERDTTAERSNTLDSVYGCYSVGDGEAEAEMSPGPSTSTSASSYWLSSAFSPTSTSPATSVPLVDCERVFTPPPYSPSSGRGQASTSRASSPATDSSVSPPIDVELGSPFRPHLPSAVTRTVKAKGKAKAKGMRKGPVLPSLNVSMEETPWDEAMDAGSLSTKVAFGFRFPHSVGRGRPDSSASHGRNQSISRSRSRLRVSTDLADLRRKSRSKDRSVTPGSSSPSPSHHKPGLRPFRLSPAFSSGSSLSSSLSRISSPNDSTQNLSIPQSPSVSSDYSLSNNRLLSSACSSPLIPHHVRNTLIPANDISPPILPWDHANPPLSAPVSHSHSWNNALHSRPSSHNFIPPARYHAQQSSRLPELAVNHDDADGLGDATIQNDLPISPLAHTPHSRSIVHSPMHAIATPAPTLLFAIASDDVAQVKRVLESGEAGPNDQVGPQSALAFTLTNDKLQHKTEIVKALLAFGADPSVLKNPEMNPPQRGVLGMDTDQATSPRPTLPEGMDPATRYYITRAESSTRRISQTIQRSSFRPLTRLAFELVGQDCALEQLFRVLGMHSQQISVAPVVVLLCGPSGHGKSMLARKFGSLLNVPTHTVNMTTLRSFDDLWQCISTSPYEQPSDTTLAQFLMQNEGKRCVVVLDEIEKTEDEKTLWPLLMPWELGRCSPEAGQRHIDVRNVIWLGTSNIGEDLVFDYNASRQNPEAITTREEYTKLINLLRPLVSARLGTSLLSRVTTVLPFVPLMESEKKAIAAEALHSLAGEQAMTMSPEDVEALVARALMNYLPVEGARSLHRAVSNQLVDYI